MSGLSGEPLEGIQIIVASNKFVVKCILSKILLKWFHGFVKRIGCQEITQPVLCSMGVHMEVLLSFEAANGSCIPVSSSLEV